MSQNKWNRATNPPPSLFTGQSERDFVKQINDELIERVIGQKIAYYPIDLETTEFHPIYGESIHKNFKNPVVIKPLIKFENHTNKINHKGIDRIANLSVFFHRRRLTEDQNLYVREGDFIKFGDFFYEILNLEEGRWLFGQADHSFQIKATCAKARTSQFEGK